jgi:7,8-dihydroneopterin aldolase/epimerase/oxygenase
MTDRITLTGLTGRGRHGVYDHERDESHPFVVDLVLELDITPAAKSDDVADTVDYGLIASSVVAIVEGEPVNLIETLAQRIADACLAEPIVDKVRVTVHKPDAPLTVPFDDVAVTIERSRG